MSNRQPTVKAFLWMLLTLASFSFMAIAVKELSATIATAEILFFRSLIGLTVVSILVYMRGVSSIKTTKLNKHVARNSFHFIGQYGWLYGIAYLPLAEVFALEFTVPIWTAIIASLFLNEAITKMRLLSTGCGFLGVLVILRPTSEIIHPAAIVVLAGAIGYAIAHTLTRSIVSRNGVPHDSTLSILFYMCLMQLPVGLVLMINSWVMPVGVHWFWLLVVGLTALSAHYGLSKALSYADATVVIPMDFMRLPLIMLVGWYFYSEPIGGFVLLGAAMMVLGTTINLRNEKNHNLQQRKNQA